MNSLHDLAVGFLYGMPWKWTLRLILMGVIVHCAMWLIMCVPNVTSRGRPPTVGADEETAATRTALTAEIATLLSAREGAPPMPHRPVKPPLPRRWRYFAADSELGGGRRIIFVHIRDVNATDGRFLLCRDDWVLGDDVTGARAAGSGRSAVKVPGGVAAVCPDCRAQSIALTRAPVQDDPPVIDAARPDDVERRTFLPGGIILRPGETYSEPERR